METTKDGNDNLSSVHVYQEIDIIMRLLFNKYASKIIYIYDQYRYEDLCQDDSTREGVYIIYYYYDYLQPSNIFDIKIYDLVKDFTDECNHIFDKYLIEVEKFVYYSLNFKKVSINSSCLKLLFDYDIIFK